MNIAYNKKLKFFLKEEEKNVEVKIIERENGIVNWWLKAVGMEINKIIINDEQYYIRCKNSKKEVVDCVASGEHILENFSEHIKRSSLARFDFVKLPSKSLKPEKTLIFMK